MRMYQRNSIWWVDLRAEGMGRVSTGCSGITDARKAAKRMVEGGSAGKSLAEALDRAMLEHYSGSKGERNALSIHSQLREDIGTIKLDRITTPLMRTYGNRLKEEGLTGSTINRRLAHLSKTLKLACEWGWLDAPVHIPRHKEGKVRHRELTDMEEVDLMVALSLTPSHGWLGGLVCFLLDTGSRLSEALSVSEVDRKRALDTGLWTIWINKGDRPRSVPLTSRAMDALEQWSWAGRTPRQCQKAWQWVRAQLGMEDDAGFVLHCLRHTCASRMVQRGVSLLTVKEILGHSTVAVTERYAVMNADHLKAAVGVLESVPPGKTGG